MNNFDHLKRKKKEKHRNSEWLCFFLLFVLEMFDYSYNKNNKFEIVWYAVLVYLIYFNFISNKTKSRKSSLSSLSSSSALSF